MIAISGCVTNKKLIKDARIELNDIKCIEKVEQKLKKAQCSNIEVYRGSDYMVFRCKKADLRRDSFWDSWWFRLTSTWLKHDPVNLSLVKAHTICVDQQFRIEAYPPTKEK